MNHRVLIAGGVSLGVHALVVVGLLLVPSPRPAPGRAAHRGDGKMLFVRIEGFDRPRSSARPAPAREKEEYIPFDVQPSLAAQPVVSAVPGGNDGPPSPAPAPRGGTGVGTGLLSAPALARRVVFVVDRSVSMGLSGGLERARVELRAALRGLPADARFQVIAYNQAPRRLMTGEMVSAHPENVEQAIRLLDDLEAEGRTDHIEALKAAMSTRPDVVFLVTDADDLVDRPLRVNLAGTTLNVVELGRGAGHREGPLARLARGSGGSYRRVAAFP